MSNVHGLYSGKKSDSDEEDHENDRYVGGIGDRGGGSGLAVQPNRGDDEEEGNRDAVFGLAENATSEDQGQVRRTITMYRDGFVVDDGLYRRLDDPANADFLRSLARGQTPRELLEDDDGQGGNVTVGLVDKRSEEYVEEFRSFSGQGTSLGTSAAAASGGSSDGVFDPSSLPETTPPVNESNKKSLTSIQVRLVNGQRRVIRISVSSTVTGLAAQLRNDANGEPFQLVAGFPPRPLVEPNATIEEAGLKGAQVSMKKA